jgi:macrolide transport system ATP-binding/permease protein
VSLANRIANLFRRNKIDREIEAELASHLAMRIEDNLAAGMDPNKPAAARSLSFGNRRPGSRTQTTEADAALYFASIGADLRYAWRQLRKNPGFAFTAILVLGTWASRPAWPYSPLWTRRLLKPLPYRDPIAPCRPL